MSVHDSPMSAHGAPPPPPAAAAAPAHPSLAQPPGGYASRRGTRKWPSSSSTDWYRSRNIAVQTIAEGFGLEAAECSRLFNLPAVASGLVAAANWKRYSGRRKLLSLPYIRDSHRVPPGSVTDPQSIERYHLILESVVDGARAWFGLAADEPITQEDLRDAHRVLLSAKFEQNRHTVDDWTTIDVPPVRKRPLSATASDDDEEGGLGGGGGGNCGGGGERALTGEETLPAHAAPPPPLPTSPSYEDVSGDPRPSTPAATTATAPSTERRASTASRRVRQRQDTITNGTGGVSCGGGASPMRGGSFSGISSKPGGGGGTGGAGGAGGAGTSSTTSTSTSSTAGAGGAGAGMGGPLTVSVAWQQPPAGVPLPLTLRTVRDVNEAFDGGTWGGFARWLEAHMPVERFGHRVLQYTATSRAHDDPDLRCFDLRNVPLDAATWDWCLEACAPCGHMYVKLYSQPLPPPLAE